MEKFFIEDQVVNETVQDYLNVDYIFRYDAAYPPYTALPEGRFDTVICTDVLEHCPEDDLPWIVEELFAYLKKLVFANVASYPASKLLPNGENAHCTQLDAERWRSIFSTVAQRHAGVLWEVLHVSRHKQPDDFEFVETRLGTVP